MTASKPVSFDMNQIMAASDLLMITLDTLRFDAAQAAWEAGELTYLAPYLGDRGWQPRHTPASFTYAAHHAFFAGFLPTPCRPGPHPRLFASRFVGSESTCDKTFVFDEPTLPEALQQQGWTTICIGGTGFFNPESSLGKVLPGLFGVARWSSEMGVAAPFSAKHQIDAAIEEVEAADTKSPVFLFINIAAIHQPNWFYQVDASGQPTTLPAEAAGSRQPNDSLTSHRAALVNVDRQLGRLFDFFRSRRQAKDVDRGTFCILCSDHGTAYGESGYFGHRLAHETVWKVPYAEFVL